MYKLTTSVFLMVLMLTGISKAEIFELQRYFGTQGQYMASSGGLLIDYNNDGKLDLVGAPIYNSNSLEFFTGNGTTMVYDQSITAMPYLNFYFHSLNERNKASYYVDLNNDGVKDLLLYGANHYNCTSNSIRIYWGSSVSPYFSTNDYTTLVATSPFCVGAVAVDFDNDGLVDIHVRSASGYCTMYKNLGNKVFSQVTTFNAGRDINAFFYDIDGDNITDMLYGKSGWADGAWGFRFNKGLGDGNFNSSTQVYNSSQRASDVSIMPIQANPSQNNVIDMAFLSKNDGTDGNTLYLAQYNSTNANFSITSQAIATGLIDFSLVAPIDYNGDGFEDIIARYRNTANINSFTTLVYYNNGMGSFNSKDTLIFNQPYYTTQVSKESNGVFLITTGRINSSSTQWDSLIVFKHQYFSATLPNSTFSACPSSSIQMPAPVIHNGTPNASYTYSWTPANLFANPYSASPNTKNFTPYSWGEYNVAVSVTESGTGKTATCSTKVLVNYSQPFSLSKSVIQKRIATPVVNLNEFITPIEVWSSGNAPAATPTVYKWYDRFNELIGTVTNLQEPLNYIASNSRGIYKTYVVAENGECQSDSRNFYIFYTLRREGDESGLVMADGAALDAYPVPTDGRLSIDAAFAEEGGIEISVIDILGSERIKFHRTGLDLGEEIDLGSLPAGVYFLTVQSGNTTLRKQIVKQ